MAHRVIVLGNSNVGKTSLISRYIWNNLPRRALPTMEYKEFYKLVDFTFMEKVWFLDTPGRTCDLESVRDYIRKSNGAVIVYEIHNRQSYDAAKEWVLKLKPKREENKLFLIALVGNKADLAGGRVVSTAEAEEYATKDELLFMETSAKTSLNVVEIFKKLAGKIESDGWQALAKMIEESIMETF